mgnify:CR=1 FL=1
MKKLSLYVFLVLTWCNVGFAEEITDFELDGISIGDSLLEYMSEEEIMNNQKKSNEAYKNLGKQIFFEAYMESTNNDIDFKSFFVKSNDKNFIIQAMYVSKNYENNIDECFTRLNNITKHYDENYKSLKKKSEKLKILYDPSGKSYLKRTVYKFKNGDRIAFECYDFDETFQKDYGYQNPDGFDTSFNRKELYLWINP